MFPQFEIFGKTFGMYGLCAVVGILACGFVAVYIGKGRKIRSEHIILAITFAGIGLTVGGHLLFGLVGLPDYIEYLKATESITFEKFARLTVALFSGSVFYGGFLGALLAISIYGKRKNGRGEYLDIFAVLAPLFHAFGRVGCFFAGCCYGIESKFGFTAHGNTISPAVNGISRFPVQLLESALNLALFAVIMYMFRKNKLYGRLIYIYMAAYSVIRFCLEFLRGDEVRGFFLYFSTSQWISLLLFPISVIILIIRIKKEHKQTPEN